MNRKRKCRAKRKDNGEWVYGFYVEDHRNTFIITIGEGMLYALHLPYKVIPESVGQSTGIKDKKAVEIYANSLVKYRNSDISSVDIFRVLWDTQKIGYILTQEGLRIDNGLWNRDWLPYRTEVIGDVYDNPALMENNNGRS